jgi:tripartite-type tricarboxylate transporter receptor subunit TctC
LQKNVPFDVERDFQVMGMLGIAPYLLVVNNSLAAKSVKELIALAKAGAGKLVYASTGVGGGLHLTMELFRMQAGIDMLHVPYKGNGQALIDLVAGQVHVLFTSTISGMQHVKSGRARGIAVTSPRRIAAFPELATVSESGLPGFEMQNMYGLYAPAGVPAALQAKIARDVGEIMNSPEVREKVTADGAEVAPTRSPAEFAKRFAQEMDMWDKFIKSSGIKVE